MVLAVTATISSEGTYGKTDRDSLVALDELLNAEVTFSIYLHHICQVNKTKRMQEYVHNELIH
jgi:hypothetical protein